MPLSPDTSTPELDVTGPAAAASLPLQTEGSGPKYSPLDVAAAAFRTNWVGKAYDHWANSGAANASESWLEDPNYDPRPRIPDHLKPFADKYWDVHTDRQADTVTADLEQTIRDGQTLSSSKYGAATAFVAGNLDPVAIASMAIPIAGEARLANAVKLALVGGGVATADQALMHTVDPLSDWDSGAAMNIGAASVLGGVLGGVMKPHVDLEKAAARQMALMEARLREDLAARSRVPEPTSMADSADKIAADLRAAIEAEHAAASAKIAPPGEGAGGLTDGSEIPFHEQGSEPGRSEGSSGAPGEPLVDPNEQREPMIQAAIDEMKQGPGVLQRLEERYGPDLDGTLRARAEAQVDAELAPHVEAHQQAVEAEAAADTVQKIEAALQPKADPEAQDVRFEAAKRVRDMIIDQIAGAGRHTSFTRADFATLHAAWYDTQAARMGMTADELYAQFPLKVVGGEAGGLLGQAAHQHPTFYSAALRAVEGLRQPHASGEQWWNTIRNMKGVKPDELKYLGLEQFLKEHPSAKIPRQEILDHIRDHELHLSERIRGGPDLEPMESDIGMRLEKLGYTLEQGDEGLILKSHNDGEGDRGSTFHDIYFDGAIGMSGIPEHELEKELELAQLREPDARITHDLSPFNDPDRAGVIGSPEDIQPAHRDEVWNLYQQAIDNEGADLKFAQWQSPGGSNAREFTLALPMRAGEGAYHEGHYPEPNVVVHMRTNERIGPNGTRDLHLEEVQSDWHQQGRDKGYAGPDAREAVKAAELKFERAAQEWRDSYEHLRTELGKYIDLEAYPGTFRGLVSWIDYGTYSAKRALEAINSSHLTLKPELEQLPAELEKAVNRYREGSSLKESAAHETHLANERMLGAIPDAPFKKNWHELALKRMIRYAADNGFDRLTWTTGKTQVERWTNATRRAVDEIHYEPEHDGHQRVAAFKNGYPVVSLLHDVATGNIVKATTRDFQGKDLHEVFGKDIADRLAAEAKAKGSLKGDELTVGGEGFKGFYDKILVDAANKIGKPYGTSVARDRMNLSREPRPDRLENATAAQVITEARAWLRRENLPSDLLVRDEQDVAQELGPQHRGDYLRWQRMIQEAGERDAARVAGGNVHQATPGDVEDEFGIWLEHEGLPLDTDLLHPDEADHTQFTAAQREELLDWHVRWQNAADAENLAREQRNNAPDTEATEQMLARSGEPGAKTEAVHALPITQELRDASLAGQPLFQKGRQRPIGRDGQYQADLFGQPLPPAPPAAGAEAGATEFVGGPPGTYARRTQIAPTQTFEIRSGKVTTPQEAANAMASLARQPQERFLGLVTDKDGKPLAIVGDFKGTVDGASVYPAVVAGEALRVKGAANIWFGHNHPSGKSSLSYADERINGRLAELFKGTGIEPRGILAVGGGAGPEGREWSWQHHDGTGDFGHTGPETGGRKVPIVATEFVQHDVLGPAITNPTAAREGAQRISGGQSGIIMMDARHQPVAFIPLDGLGTANLGRMRGTDAPANILRAAHEAGASSALMVEHPGANLGRDDVTNVGNLMAMADIRLVDHISIDGHGQVTSAAEMGRDLTNSRGLQQVNQGSYDPATLTMSLFETADRSTFLHESGHHFLNVLTQLAAREGAPIGIKQDVATLLDWMGVKGTDEQTALERWHDMDLDAQRNGHEKFARGFENYLREGTAPSEGLKTIFGRFKAWLQKIYQTATELKAPLSPAVREVMDRMLTETPIARAPPATMRVSLQRLAGDEVLRAGLEGMKGQTGWAQIGGKLMRDDLGNAMDRTEWIPTADWFGNRPRNEAGGYVHSEAQIHATIDKALAGEKLGAQQQRLIDYLVDVHDQMTASHDYLPHANELTDNGLEHSMDDAMKSAMIARAIAIDEGAVESLARIHEDDDITFMRKIKEFLDAHDQDAKAARNGADDRAALGAVGHGEAAGGAAGASADGGKFFQTRDTPPTAGGSAGEGASGGGSRRPGLELTSPRGTAGAGAAARPPAAPRAGPDLFGQSTGPQQALADAERAKDARRNSGQQSLETGNPGDLFSQARGQHDLTAMLAALPPEKRAPFEARIKALELPQGNPTQAPIISNPGGDSSIGAAMATGMNLHDYDFARGGRVLGKALGWFAPGSRLLRSPSIWARRITTYLTEVPELLNYNVPTAANPHGIANPINVEQLLKGYEGTWYEAYKGRRLQYEAYVDRVATKGVIDGEGPKMTRTEFNEAISHAMRNGDTSLTPEVAAAAKDTRAKVFEPLKQRAIELGLLKDAPDLLQGTAESYLMRQYDRHMIKANLAEWNQTLREGFLKQADKNGEKLDQAELNDMIQKVTRNVMGSERGTLDLNPSVFDGVTPSGRLKSRQLLLPDQELEKFLVHDIDTLTHAYIRSLAPEVEITARFGDRDMELMLGQVRDEYAMLRQRAESTGDETTMAKLFDREKADLRDIKGIRDRIYGTFGVPADSSAWFIRAGKMLRSVNSLRMLGTANYSHLPDAANVIMRHGLGNTFADASRLASSLEALRLSSDEAKRMGVGLDMVSNTLAAELGNFQVESAYKSQRLLNRATKAYTVATLETPWIAYTKQFASAMASDEILRGAMKVGAGEVLTTAERIRMNQYGLDQATLQRIADQHARFGRNVNGLEFGMSDLWDHAETARTYEAAVVQAADASTLSPSKGDTPLWTSSEWGKALFQFKTFGAVAIRKVLIPLSQGLARGDARAAQGLAALVAAGTMTYVMKQIVSGQPIEQNKGRFALEVLDKSNLLGWTGEFFYPALWSVGMQDFSRWGDRKTWETIGGPVLGTAVDAWDLRLPARIRGSLTNDPKNRGLNRDDIHRIRRLLPGQNYWPLRRAINALETKVGDSMNLPPQPPRRGTE